MVIMDESWFLGCNKYITVVGDVGDEEDCACVCQSGGVVGAREGAHGKSLYLPLSFAVNLKQL